MISVRLGSFAGKEDLAPPALTRDPEAFGFMTLPAG
jgi:hypothetical protein